jgi:hypothetical protein
LEGGHERKLALKFASAINPATTHGVPATAPALDYLP